MSLTADQTTTWHTTIETPIGPLTTVRDRDGIAGLFFPGHWHLPPPTFFGRALDDGFDDARRQLGEYFGGTRRGFDLPLTTFGNTFSRRVWDAIARIPYGSTTTYGAIATELGDVTPREVGGAVGRNPHSIFVACHRVVGADGKLVGYAGGLDRKRHLLELEGVLTPSGEPQRLWESGR